MDESRQTFVRNCCDTMMYKRLHCHKVHTAAAAQPFIHHTLARSLHEIQSRYTRFSERVIQSILRAHAQSCARASSASPVLRVNCNVTSQSVKHFNTRNLQEIRETVAACDPCRGMPCILVAPSDPRCNRVDLPPVVCKVSAIVHQ